MDIEHPYIEFVSGQMLGGAVLNREERESKKTDFRSQKPEAWSQEPGVRS
jgi:hypothetical protein